MDKYFKTTLRITIALLWLLTVALLTACQPTPEEPVVVGKGDDHLEEMIRANVVVWRSELCDDQCHRWQCD